MKKTITFISAVVMSLSVCCYAFADSIFSPFTSGFEQQQSSVWCWVASARNLSVSRYGKNSINKSQYDVAYEIRGNDLYNGGGTYKQTAKAVNSFHSANVLYNKDSESINWIRNRINEGAGLIVTRSVHSGNDRYYGHAELVYGYVQNSKMLYFYDPAVGSVSKNYNNWKMEGSMEYDGNIYYC